MAAETFARSIKDRLHELIVQRGYSVSGLAIAMGRSNTWLAKKLDGHRPLVVDDVDLVCRFLEVTPPTVR